MKGRYDIDAENRRKVNIIREPFHKFYDPNNKYSRENRRQIGKFSKKKIQENFLELKEFNF